MKPSISLSITALALSLSACGGGGIDSPGPPSMRTLPTANLVEYEGVWMRDAASDVCLPSFPYNAAYHYRLRDISVVMQNNNLVATIAFTAYGDVGCTVKQGLVTETFSLNPQLASLPGRSNALQGTPVMTASRIGADGGLGATLTSMPDGTLSRLNGHKYAADVENGRLYMTTSSFATTLDSTGHPAALVASEYFVR